MSIPHWLRSIILLGSVVLEIYLLTLLFKFGKRILFQIICLIHGDKNEKEG